MDEDIRILRLVKPRLPERPVILDIGASNGCWTQRILPLFPAATVFLFEPGASYNDEIETALNGHERLKHFQIAIGDKNGPAVFHVLPDRLASTTIPWDGTFGQRTTVPMRTIDSLINEGAITQPDLIKMDIQGGELAALKGAARALRNVCVLQLETWITQGYGAATPLLAELMEFLRPFQFRLFDLGMQYRHGDGSLYAIDVCFVKDELSKGKFWESLSRFRSKLRSFCRLSEVSH